MPKPPIISDIDLCLDKSRPNFMWGGFPNHRRMFLDQSHKHYYRIDGPATEHLRTHIRGNYWWKAYYVGSAYSIDKQEWRNKYSRVIDE